MGGNAVPEAQGQKDTRHQCQDVRSEAVARPQRCERVRLPRDVQIIGALTLIAGILGIIGAVSILLRPGRIAWDKFVFFGALHVSSDMEACLYYAILSALLVLTGAGLLQVRWWAWWLEMLVTVESLTGVFVRPEKVWNIPVAIVLNLAFLAWLVYRVGFFHPFGHRPPCREVPVKDSIGEDAPPVPTAKENKME